MAEKIVCVDFGGIDYGGVPTIYERSYRRNRQRKSDKNLRKCWEGELPIIL